MYTTVQSLRGVRQIMALLAIVGLLISLSQGIFVGMAHAQQVGEVNTVTGSCGAPVNANQYEVGQAVLLKGKNFDPNTQYSWQIAPTQGGGNATPIASGVHSTDANGEFCFTAIAQLAVGTEDKSPYKATYGEVKSDVFSVKAKTVTNGTITVKKVLVNEPNGVTPDDFSFTVNGGPATQFDVSGTNASVQNLKDGPFNVVEVEENGTGYKTTYSGCSAIDLTADGATCTITNTYPTLCTDDSAVNYNEEGQCMYESEVTICKYDNNQNPLSDWTVGLAQGQDTVTGVTGENGCVTLVDWTTKGNNIPYGSYTLTETMKEGWENVSGDGDSVEVDSATENFTLVNREIPPICDDPTANNYNQEGRCTYSYEDVTLCKVSNEGEPLAGWTLELGSLSGETAVETGCVTFDEVKHGDYVVDEVMKENWINIVAEGFVAKGATVKVDDENTTFTLKNKMCAEGEIARENQCVPVDPEKETITMCKYDGDDEPVVGWGMTLTNRDDITFDDLVTGENGCVDQEVDPADGPWYVIEEARANWTQKEVYVMGGATQVTDFGTICRFFPKFVNELPTSESAIVAPEAYKCDFFNSYDDPDPRACEITVVSDTTNSVNGGSAELAWTHGNWITGLAGSVAQWIWGSEFVTDPSSEETQVFTKTFNWNGPVTSALLDIATDNTYVVKINGVQVAADANADNFSAADEDIDVASEIVTGVNTIEISVTNLAAGTQDPQANPAGLLYNLTIVGDTETDCTYTPEPDPLSCDIFSNKSVVSAGETFELNWNTDQATYVEIDQGIGSGLALDGSTTTSIQNTTTYTLTAWDDNEDSVNCDVTVTVEEDGGGGGSSSGGGGSTAPRCELFTSERDGEGVNLTWETSRGNSLKITANGDEIFSTDEDDEVDAGDFVYEGAGDIEFELTVSRGSRERTCVTRIDGPTPQVLGEQVSLVPQGAPDAGNGGTAPVAIPQVGVLAALIGGARGIRNAK